jgi:glycosyltransferase involved in cell wall biosynthesis
MEQKNKQKILYLITQSELGGAQKYVFDLAKNLKNDFEIFVGFGEQGDEGELAKKIKEENIVFYTIPHLKRAISPFNDLRAIFEIKKLIKQINPDIIHLNSSKISILGSIASRQLTIVNYQLSIVYTAHGWIFNEPMSRLKKTLYKYAEKFTARFKDIIICVSEFDRQIAIKEKIAPADKLITIHNGIEPIKFLSRESAQQELGISDKGLGTLNIVSIGNLYQTKGFKYLIQAANILVTRYALRIMVTIIGEGREQKNLEDIIKTNNLKNNVILTGRIDHASKYLKAFDLYVCSSIKEGLSYTIIEAMQAGLPIVATKVGGNPELINDQADGLLAEPANPEDLVDKIKKIIDNHELGRIFGQSVEKKVSHFFSLNSMLKKTKDVYRAQDKRSRL